MRFLAPALLMSCTLLQGCSAEDEPEAARRNLCEIGTFCDVPFPKAITLSISTTPMRRDERLILLLRRDLPQGNFIFELGPEKQEVWIDSKHQKHLPLRFYFVSQRKTCETGSLWVVFDHLESEPPKTQVLMNDVNRARSDILTNGHEYRHPFNPYKIAVIDKNTQIGPTFFAGYPHHLYVRYEFDSRFAREEWERSATSSCGGGPLSAVPQQWIDERTRDCKILDDRFERAQARWYVRLARRLRNL